MVYILLVVMAPVPAGGYASLRMQYLNTFQTRGIVL